MPLDAPAHLLEHGYLPLIRFANLHPFQDSFEPAHPLATGRALSAALVLVEVCETADGCNHVHAIVEHGDGGGPQSRPLGAQVVEFREGLVALLLVEDGHGGSAGDAGLERAPPATHAPAVLLNEILEGDAHGLLHHHEILDVSGDGEELGAAVVLVPEGVEPGGTPPEDGGRHRDGLHIRDRGGTPEETHTGGERRLEAGLALLPFQTLDQRRLLPTDVRAGAAVQVDVKVVAEPGYILGGVYETIFSNL